MPGCDPFTEREIIEILKTRGIQTGDCLRNQTLFTLELATGGRVNELLKLKRGDILDANGRIRNKITFTMTKNKCSRTVDLINQLPIHFLKKWLVRLEDNGYLKTTSNLFPSPYITNRPITSRQIYNIYIKAVVELKLSGNYGTHSCRKTWAMNTYKYYHARQLAGELIDPLVKLQEAGGWKTIEAARRYLSFMLEDSKDSQKALYPELQKLYGGK